MPGRAQERVRLRVEFLDAHPLIRRQNASCQNRDVRVVAGVVVGHHLPEPAVVPLERGLERLALLQLGLVLRHRHEAPQDEVELDRHWLLTPQRAVVVEGGDPLGRRHVAAAALIRDARDEVDDRPLRRSVVPGCERGCHRSFAVFLSRTVRAASSASACRCSANRTPSLVGAPLLRTRDLGQAERRPLSPREE